MAKPRFQTWVVTEGHPSLCGCATCHRFRVANGYPTEPLTHEERAALPPGWHRHEPLPSPTLIEAASDESARRYAKVLAEMVRATLVPHVMLGGHNATGSHGGGGGGANGANGPISSTYSSATGMSVTPAEPVQPWSASSAQGGNATGAKPWSASPLPLGRDVKGVRPHTVATHNLRARRFR